MSLFVSCSFNISVLSRLSCPPYAFCSCCPQLPWRRKPRNPVPALPKRPQRPRILSPSLTIRLQRPSSLVFFGPLWVHFFSPITQGVIGQKMWFPLGTILEHSGKHFCFGAPPGRMPGSAHKGCFSLRRSFFYLRLVIFLQAYAGLWRVQTCTVQCSEGHLGLARCFVTCPVAASQVFCTVLGHGPTHQPNRHGLSGHDVANGKNGKSSHDHPNWSPYRETCQPVRLALRPMLTGTALIPQSS